MKLHSSTEGNSPEKIRKGYLKLLLLTSAATSKHKNDLNLNLVYTKKAESFLTGEMFPWQLKVLWRWVFHHFLYIHHSKYKLQMLWIANKHLLPDTKKSGFRESYSLALWLFCLLFLSHEELGLYHSGMQCPCNVCQSYTHTHTPHGCMWISAKWDSQLYSHRFQRTICLQPPLNTWGPVKLYWK